tara:strand:- start:514 stop:954 length:441 start_codon:yes stop_codon:yes gene_type:complete
MKTYTRSQLPNWNVADLISLGYTFHFAIVPLRKLIDCTAEVPDEVLTAKLGAALATDYVFEPIICDENYTIITGHEGVSALSQCYTVVYPVPCAVLSGVSVDDVVSYYESICLHKQAVADAESERQMHLEWADWDNDRNIAEQVYS